MNKNLPARLEETNQRWITGIVNGKIQAITRIGPCALVITPEELPKLILMTDWIGDELANQIRSALDDR
ncbi:MAG: hypothetical protein ACI978_002182 [Oleispira sp.]|jgi:hypothetical protein